MGIEDVLHKHQERLLTFPNVTGVGIGEKNGKPVIVVFVSAPINESFQHSEDKIPKTLDGYEVEIRPEIKIG